MPSTEKTVSDQELLRRFLKKTNCEASLDWLASQGITTMTEFKTMTATDALREKMAVKIRKADNPTLNQEYLAEIIDPKNESKIDVEKVLATVDQTAPSTKRKVNLSANDELKNYLGEKGFSSSYLPVFESRGITSLETLNRVIAKPTGDTYKGLLGALKDGTEIDDAIYSGAPELGEAFQALSQPEIESAQEIQAISKDFRQEGMDEAALKRYSQLKEAVQQVDALRQKDADAANKLSEEISKGTKAQLESILSRTNSKELLNIFDKYSPTTVKDLNAALDTVSNRLSAGSEDEFNNLIYKADNKSKTPEQLAVANCIRRGVLITATGIYECSGSDLVKGMCSIGTPGPYEEVVSDYESEQNYQFAEKTIKESSHTYSTSNSLLGGFFGSSGIGAVSGAFQYAKSQMSSEARASASQTGIATKVKERSICAPKAVLTLPRERMHLSPTAQRYLKQIASATEENKNEYARLFLANFGGHVFRSITLGGRYSYVARAESKNKTAYEGLDSALSEAQQRAGSFAGGFFGSFLGGGSSAHQDATTSASATSMTTIVGTQNQTVHVSISVRGGLQEMPLDQWKQSLLLDKWWRVIDRREAIAVWDLMRAAEIPGMAAEDRTDLAKLLERVWVQDIFLASLAESNMASYQKFAQMLQESPVPNSVIQLESRLRENARKLAPPSMALYYLTVESLQASRGGYMSITLPPSYKILSGGGGALKNASHVLIESYPEIVTLPDNTPQWRWHLKTKAALCADGRDRCSTVESAQAHLTIGLIVLHDPRDEWDVAIISRNSAAEENAHEINLAMHSDRLITGGGARISRYSIPAITGSGFSSNECKRAEDGYPLRAYCVKTSNMASHNDDFSKVTHSLTVCSIGIKAANGAPLLPVYSVKRFSKNQKSVPNQCHLDHELVHERGADGSHMLGGGAWVSGDLNFLSWSLPVVDRDGPGQWKAYSADRAGRYSEQEMQVVTIGLKNIQTTMKTGRNSITNFTMGFDDAFNKWNKDGYPQ